MSQERMTVESASTEKGLVATRGSDMVAQGGPGSIGGTTKIADSVVSRIAGLAAREVPGVHDMTSTGIGSAFGNIAGRVTGQDQADKGVAVQVGEMECIVDLNIVVDYEASIPQVATALRRNVAGRLKAMTGLEAKEININVADLFFLGQGDKEQQPPAVR
ncbi:MAG: hypothetical protein JWO59_2918 [Chloroflexi bacterium]|jgi:uncharacterized alkaline shock family protein YloU|nr:hypothetical protein [Chloroflexota bacterium]